MTSPLVVDLGFGERPHTTLELAERLGAVKPDCRVVGIEIDPDRVAAAQSSATERIAFVRGGFEIPLPDSQTADVVRAFNVLRQYDEAEVAEAWNSVLRRLSPGGIFLDGTSDEIGRVATWVGLTEEGPDSFTIAVRLTGLETPSVAAERLVKALIHRNVPGEAIHQLLADLDRAWAVAAPLQVYSPVQRWIATVRTLKESGWPIRDSASVWRLGEVTVDWLAVAPRP